MECPSVAGCALEAQDSAMHETVMVPAKLGLTL